MAEETRNAVDLSLDADLLFFVDATVELTLDSTKNNQKKETVSVFSPVPSLEQTANSSSKHQSTTYDVVGAFLFCVGKQWIGPANWNRL